MIEEEIIVHWSDAWIHCDAENKNIYQIEDSDLIIFEWYIKNKVVTMVFDSEDNTVMMWRVH